MFFAKSLLPCEKHINIWKRNSTVKKIPIRAEFRPKFNAYPSGRATVQRENGRVPDFSIDRENLRATDLLFILFN
jgi:hypothetical protein